MSRARARARLTRTSTCTCTIFLAFLAPAGIRAAPAPVKVDIGWLGQHLSVEAAAVGGWRAGWEDSQHGGFQALLGGTEVNAGLEFASGFVGVIAGARALGGRTVETAALPPGGAPAPAPQTCVEATGHLGVQLRVFEGIRVLAGASVGRLWLWDDARAPDPGSPALLAGGFLRLGVDWLTREGGLVRALSMWLRIDMDGHVLQSVPPPAQQPNLPTSSLSLAAGFGLRL